MFLTVLRTVSNPGPGPPECAKSLRNTPFETPLSGNNGENSDIQAARNRGFDKQGISGNIRKCYKSVRNKPETPVKQGVTDILPIPGITVFHTLGSENQGISTPLNTPGIAPGNTLSDINVQEAVLTF